MDGMAENTRRLAVKPAACFPYVEHAAQTQLVRDGRIHNYMRMLWAKKILEWSASPQDALETTIELNSYNGIFWVLGRYDRPWGPERPVYGTVRHMSSESALNKTNAREYVRRCSL